MTNTCTLALATAVVILPVVVPVAAPAATIQPPPALILSNFQSANNVTAGQFGGFAFSNQRIYWDSPSNVWLGMGGMTTIESGPVAQSFTATASVDFDIPGYWVTGISMAGRATTDGGTVAVTFGTTGPCSAFMTGSNSFVHGCSLPPGTSSGTITAYLSLRSDALTKVLLPNGGWYYNSDTGTIGSPSVTLWVTPDTGTIHNPEPVTLLTIGAGLVGIGVAAKRRRRGRQGV